MCVARARAGWACGCFMRTMMTLLHCRPAGAAATRCCRHSLLLLLLLLRLQMKRHPKDQFGFPRLRVELTIKEGTGKGATSRPVNPAIPDKEALLVEIAKAIPTLAGRAMRMQQLKERNEHFARLRAEAEAAAAKATGRKPAAAAAAAIADKKPAATGGAASGGKGGRRR